MDKESAAVFGPPTAVLDVLRALRDQVSPRLSNRQDFHGTTYKVCNFSACFSTPTISPNSSESWPGSTLQNTSARLL